MEGMIDDIDSTLNDKFETVFNAVKNDGKDAESNDEFEEDLEEFNSDDYAGYNTVNAYSTIAVPQTEHREGTVQMHSTSEEEEAFRNLESALKTWHKPAV